MRSGNGTLIFGTKAPEVEILARLAHALRARCFLLGKADGGSSRRAGIRMGQSNLPRPLFRFFPSKVFGGRMASSSLIGEEGVKNDSQICRVLSAQ
jgi:hypothetical protein